MANVKETLVENSELASLVAAAPLIESIGVHAQKGALANGANPTEVKSAIGKLVGPRTSELIFRAAIIKGWTAEVSDLDYLQGAMLPYIEDCFRPDNPVAGLEKYAASLSQLQLRQEMKPGDEISWSIDLADVAIRAAVLSVGSLELLSSKVGPAELRNGLSLADTQMIESQITL